jgi:type I restriction enzyme S subunit
MNVQEVQFDSLYATKSRNGIYKSSEFHGRGTKIINMGELFGFDFIGDQPMERVELTTDELEKSDLLDGDLLFGRRSLVEAGAGKCSIVVAPSEPLTFESSIIRVRPDKQRVEPKYLYYYFKSPRGKVNWSRLSVQKFRVDKWSLCRG